MSALMSLLPLLSWCGAGYLVGAIPSGYLIARLYGIADIRKTGSGNIGASNAGRLFGIIGFLLVFAADALKAYLLLSFAKWHGVSNEIDLCLFGFSLLIGNCYSIFLRGDGGRGVSTLVGVCAGLNHYVALLFAAIWVVSIILTRIATIASMISLAAIAVYLFYYNATLFFFFIVLASVVIVWRHKSNLQMLMALLNKRVH